MSAPTFDALTLLDALQERGAVLTLEDQTLYVEPPEVLTDELRGAIRQLKPELVNLLAAPVVDDSEAEAEAEEVPPALQEMPGLEFCCSGPLRGLWLRHFEGKNGDFVMIVPTKSTLSEYRRYRDWLAARRDNAPSEAAAEVTPEQHNYGSCQASQPASGSGDEEGRTR